MMISDENVAGGRNLSNMGAQTQRPGHYVYKDVSTFVDFVVCPAVEDYSSPLTDLPEMNRS